MKGPKYYRLYIDINGKVPVHFTNIYFKHNGKTYGDKEILEITK